ncbi:hypothetical protein BH23CHL2_BH23CHL2_03700 [soil metagenome]
MRRLIRTGMMVALLATLIAGAVPASAQITAEAAFGSTWERTDQPVLEGVANRTWMWGPQPFTEILSEPYAEAPGGERSVRYYDKARMEVTDPNADPDSVWYVTNGLLVVELVTGRMQVGDNEFVERSTAQVNVAGDASDPNGPTYATMAEVLDEPATPVGDLLTTRIDRNGNLTNDPSLADQGVTAAHHVPETDHSVAAPFWDFMNSSGTVYQDGQYITADLFLNPFFATGFPIAEAYWADVLVGGESRLVLMQCFERRCLTYTPGNSPGFITEAGNVGQHYHTWRYGDDPAPPPPPPPADCEPGSGQDFSGQTLLQETFVGQNLRCADFSNSDLGQPNFSEADLTRALFDDADLGQPIFRNAALTDASFRGADVAQAEFEGTILVGVDFSGAFFTQPEFVNADLTGANMADGTFVNATFSNTTCPDGTNSDESGGTCLGGIGIPEPPIPGI